jgi:hypothetical protein
MKTGKLYELSEQQIVDCDTNSYGCDGGWQMAASWYLYEKGTILRSDYPYMDVAGSCRDSEFDKVFYLVDGGYESVD